MSPVLQPRVASPSSATSVRRAGGSLGHLAPRSAAGAEPSRLQSQENRSQMQLGLQSDHKWGALGLLTRFRLAFEQLFSCDCASGNRFMAHCFRNSAISGDSINHAGFMSNLAWANMLALTQMHMT